MNFVIALLLLTVLAAAGLSFRQTLDELPRWSAKQHVDVPAPPLVDHHHEIEDPDLNLPLPSDLPPGVRSNWVAADHRPHPAAWIANQMFQHNNIAALHAGNSEA